MSTELIALHRENAEVFYGEEICKQKCFELLAKYEFPNGLLPIEAIEFGHNESSGFFWLKQKEKTVRKNKIIKKTIHYHVEITGFIEKGRIKNLTGIESKELFFTVVVSDMIVKEDSGKIEFKIPSGLSNSFPANAFMLEEKEEEKPMKA